MATPSPDPSKRLFDRSPIDIVRGVTRAKVLKELSLWVVAALSAGAGALGMQLGGGWGWSFLYFILAFLVLMLLRSQMLRALDHRTETEKAAALAAERRTAELNAARAREDRAMRKEASSRAHKPRPNPYRQKGE